MKTLRGNIVKLTNTKTVVVEVNRKVAHRLYKKLLTKTKKYQVDLNNKDVALGDEVKIEETKPISKLKNFKVVEVYKK